MLTQEERDAIRERQFRAYGFISEPYPLVKNPKAFSIVEHSLRNIIELLDMVDDLESQVVCLTAKEKAHYEKSCDKYAWKARAEAFERAIKSHYDFQIDNCCACWSCVHSSYAKNGTDPCKEINCDETFNGWQFDEARFSGDEKEEGM